MRRAIPLLLSLVSVLGSLAGARGDAPPVCDQRPPEFREPVRLGSGRGYEPGIEIDAAGTIFVTAHKDSLIREEGTRTASWLWRSIDGGTTFENVSGLNGVTQQMYAFEGDLAVDGQDRLYFVDTWLADNHFYRFSNRGTTLDSMRPAVPTYEADDRPWLAAHHDGFVYYLSNAGVKHDGRLTVHRSTDGGASFDPVGFTFPDSGWGFIDADPRSDHVYAVVNDFFYGNGITGDATGVFAWVSADRGATWSRVKIGDYEFGYNETEGHDDAYPVVAVSPVDGAVYALWTDDGKKIVLARSTDRGATWAVHDVTPFDGSYSFPWLTVGPTGDVGIIFQAARPLSSSYVYGMVWRPESGCLLDASDAGSLCSGPAGAYARLQPRPVGSQADFFQVEFSSDNALNVPYTKGQQIWFTRQTAGPNMAGTRFCGMVGSP